MQAELYHLAHCELLGELTVFVAIRAIILATASIGICPPVLISQGHTATLTKLLFHNDVRSMPASPFTGGYKMQERGTAMLPRLSWRS